MSRPDDLNAAIKAEDTDPNSLINRIKADLRIGLIGAMDQEIERLKSSMSDVEERTIAGFTLFFGTIDGVEGNLF